MKKNYLLLPVFFLFLSHLSGQFSPVLTEARQNFKSRMQLLENPSARLNLIPLKESTIGTVSPDQYLKWIKRTYDPDSPSLKRKQRIALLYETGIAYYYMDHYDSAIYSFDRAAGLTSKKINPAVYSELIFAAGMASHEMGNFRKSNEYFADLQNLPVIRKDTLRYCDILILLSENNLALFRYNDAMQYCKEAYGHYINTKSYGRISSVLILMYRIAYHTEKDTSYMEYLHLAVKMAQISGQPWRIGNALVNTGIAYYKEKDYDKALMNLLEGWKILKEFSLHEDLFGSMWIAKTYTALDKTNLAYRYAWETIRKAKKSNGYYWIYGAYDALSDCYEKMDQLDSARYYLVKAIKYEKRYGEDNLSPALYRRLSDICLKMNDNAASLKYLDTSYNLYIRVISKDNEQELVRMRAQFDYDLQKTRIKELRIKQELLLQQTRRENLIFIIVLVILFLILAFSIFLTWQYRRLHESYTAIVRKNIELDNREKIIREIHDRENDRNNCLGIEKEEDMVKCIYRLFEKEKIYKDPDLSLSLLAEKLGTNTTYLSSVINSNFNTNFRNLIHKYRIDEARSILLSDEYRNYSMEGIAAEVGYKSRSLFHQIFKEFTGVTPAIYAKTLHHSPERKDPVNDPED